MLTITDEHLKFAFFISESFPFPERRENFLDQMMKQAPGLEKAWRQWCDETSRLYGPEASSEYQQGIEQWWSHSIWVLGALFAANAEQFPPVPVGLPEEIMKEWITSPQCPDWLLGKNLSNLHEEWAELFEKKTEAFFLPHIAKVRIYALAEAFIRSVKLEDCKLISELEKFFAPPQPQTD